MQRIKLNVATSKVREDKVRNGKSCFKILLTTTILMIVPSLSLAMPPMKKTDFELVYAASSVSDCPFDKDLINEKWTGELLRARLKETPMMAEKGWLWLSANCMELESTPGAYAFVIEGQWTWSVDETKFPIYVLAEAMGIGYRDFILQQADRIMDETITEYLKVNLE